MTSKRSFRRSLGRTLGAGAVVVAVTLAGVQTTAVASGATTPVLHNQASASGFPVGVSLFDTATLGQGLNPTGTITFRLFVPWDPHCVGAPAFSWVTPVNGNGYYSSGSFIAPWAGTYRWTATYSGDANNLPTATGCSDPSAAAMVAKRTPTLSGAASLLTLGGTVSTAALDGHYPTGTLTFSLYGPNNLTCAGAPIFTSSKAVWDDGSYTSDPFVPTLPGTYQWILRYSGDANNNGATTICADTRNSVVAGGTVVPGFSLTVNPLSVKPAGTMSVNWTNIARPSAYDWVALYAVGAPDWAVKAWKYTGGAATGTVNLTVPWGTPPGSYEVRLFANNSYTRIATAPVTVTAP